MYTFHLELTTLPWGVCCCPQYGLPPSSDSWGFWGPKRKHCVLHCSSSKWWSVALNQMSHRIIYLRQGDEHAWCQVTSHSGHPQVWIWGVLKPQRISWEVRLTSFVRIFVCLPFKCCLRPASFRMLLCLVKSWRFENALDLCPSP